MPTIVKASRTVGAMLPARLAAKSIADPPGPPGLTNSTRVPSPVLR
jgi:hypothetical protein